MATQGDSLIRKAQKGLSVLAFETTKQSRILKKRMRIAALQKEVKADLRDLGSLVYNSILHDQPGILEEEEVKLLVEGVRVSRDEIEHLRDGIARMNRAHKHFGTDDMGTAAPADVPPEGTETKAPEPVVEPAPPTPSPNKAPAEVAAAPEKQAPATGDEPKRTRKTAKTQPAADTATPKAGKPATKRNPAARKKPATPKAPPAEPASEEAPGDGPEKKDNP